MNERQLSRLGSLIFGLVLILLGVLFLVDDYLGLDLGRIRWPFFILIPGLLIYLASFLLPDEPARGLSAAGSIVTMVGLVLFVQDRYDLYQTWAYVWALVAPTSLGLGWLGHALLRRDGKMARESIQLVGVGLLLFTIGFVFFELLIGLSGFRQPWLLNLWPALLILLGLVLLVRSLRSGARNKGS